MTHRPTNCRWIGFTLAVVLASASAAQASNEFLSEPTWQPVEAAAIHKQVEKYLAGSIISADKRARVLDLWRSLENETDDSLDRLANCLAEADDRVAMLVRYCSGVSQPGPLPEFAWLADSETPALVRHNMRLYLARWLVQQGYYDDALAWTDGLTTDSVVAPDALLFYRAVAFHRLVQSEKADVELDQLMEREDDLATRYQKLGELMKKDLAGLKDESLDHISRRMEDVRRRLAQGSSGEHVQGVENGVIESLDKIIKKAEDQAQQQAQSAAKQSSGGQPSGTPMQESQIAELKGPGKVDRRDIGHEAGWGNLNEKDREKALQEIGREFPSHYREVIEEYFRRLAAEESAGKP